MPKGEGKNKNHNRSNIRDQVNSKIQGNQEGKTLEGQGGMKSLVKNRQSL